MRNLITTSLLALLSAPAAAQSVDVYSIYASPGQVVPALGTNGPAKFHGSVSIATNSFGLSLDLVGQADGLPEITQIAIHGPASAGSTGPVILPVSFFQGEGSSTASAFMVAFPIDATTRDILGSGQAYLEVRTSQNPAGAVRGVIAKYESLCEPQASAASPCSQCPCGNTPVAGSRGGCLNGEGRSARLVSVGSASLASGSLAFEVQDASSNSMVLLVSGSNLLPLINSVCPAGSGIQDGLTGGLRCVGGQLLRHGTRATNAQGATASGAFTPSGGLLGEGVFMLGQSCAFQAIYRDAMTSSCGTGLNTTNAVLIRVGI